MQRHTFLEKLKTPTKPARRVQMYRINAAMTVVWTVGSIIIQETFFGMPHTWESGVSASFALLVSLTINYLVLRGAFYLEDQFCKH